MKKPPVPGRRWWTAGVLVLAAGGIAAAFVAVRLLPRPAGWGDSDRIPPDDLASADAGPGAVTLWAVGDIASCDGQGDEATAAMLAGADGTIAVLGDIAYESGSAREFTECFDSAWGRLKPRLRPTPGNHEYRSKGAAPYFAYFGTAAGAPDRGYYSYDLGEWHVVVLNSNCADVGGCGEGSAQFLWLADDLEQSEAVCTLAYWHHALTSSGRHGDDGRMGEAYGHLEAAGAELVLAGHEHHYERFGPQDADGRAVSDGPRQFVVGTGGKSLWGFERPDEDSEVRFSREYGALRLSLGVGRFAWEFLTVDGETVDSGSGSCR